MDPDVPDQLVPQYEPESSSSKMWVGMIVGVIVGLVVGYGIGHVLIGGQRDKVKVNLRKEKDRSDKLSKAQTEEADENKKLKENNKNLVEKVAKLEDKLAIDLKEAQDAVAKAKQKAAELEEQNRKLAGSIQLQGQQDKDIQAAKASFAAFREETLELIEESQEMSKAAYLLAWKRKAPAFARGLRSRLRSLQAMLNKAKVASRRERNMRRREFAQMKVKEYEDQLRALKLDISRIEQGQKQINHIIATLDPQVLGKLKRTGGKIIVPGR